MNMVFFVKYVYAIVKSGPALSASQPIRDKPRRGK
jgi:hypothetical protein